MRSTEDFTPVEIQQLVEQANAIKALALMNQLAFWTGEVGGRPAIFGGRVTHKENGNADALPLFVLYTPEIHSITAIDGELSDL